MSSSLVGLRDPVKLVIAIVVCNMAGILGAIFTQTGPDSWYAQLVKPEINPPSFVFAPVWTTLYVLMGIALYLVWMEGTDRPGVRSAMAIFGVQLVLNFLWSFLFFGLESPLLGLIDIVILWVAIVATIAAFMKVNRTAAFLLIPYLLWVSFATFLNYRILVLNA
ncbi:MAG: tryptophan-rich sensory protein [Methanomicrobiaceae archaeon]|nr:tryptophan-rich sensory protein [Methanomicrobiaceae archaeon]